MRHRATRETAAARLEEFARRNLVGSSACFEASLRRILRLAECHAPVLIRGETGTGKELAARAIHYIGARREYPFIAVNCGAIPDGLVESELFGHAKGAFTDARETYPGMVAEAAGGTLFLDEVETLTTRAQVALLRFLQDRSYRPLGGRGVAEADVRILAACNEDLGSLSERGAFRLDLLFRLNVLTLHMPALRDRTGDIRLLCEHFVKRLGLEYQRENVRIDPASYSVLERHAWPGNVRELENVIHREFLLTESGPIRVTSIDPDEDRATDDGESPEARLELGFRAAKAAAVREFERSYLCRILAETGGNVSLAARRCGKDRRALGRLIKKHGIERKQYAAG